MRRGRGETSKSCFQNRPRGRTKAEYDDEHEDEHLHWHVRHSGESRNPLHSGPGLDSGIRRNDGKRRYPEGLRQQAFTLS
jgi:hypothetical protein